MKTNLLPISFALLLALPTTAQETEDVLKRTAPGDAAEIAGRVLKEIGPFGNLGGGGSGGFNYRIQSQQRSASRPVIVSTTQPDPKDAAQLEEDLMVMSRLLDKTITAKVGEGQRNSTALGIDLYFRPGTAPTRSLYLEDYGALFLVDVPFPLIAPPKPEKTDEKAPSNSAWEQARRELYGQPGGPPPEIAQREAYDEDHVAALKEGLIDALKNGANIRGLKSDESITITVSGGGGRFPLVWPRVATTNKPGPRPRVQVLTNGASPHAGSTLTLRARKADVDAFARGKLTLEEFRKKVRWATYASASGPSSAEDIAGSLEAPDQNFDVLVR